jgi:hypothetical protein
MRAWSLKNFEFIPASERELLARNCWASSVTGGKVLLKCARETLEEVALTDD